MLDIKLIDPIESFISAISYLGKYCIHLYLSMYITDNFIFELFVNSLSFSHPGLSYLSSKVVEVSKIFQYKLIDLTLFEY